MLNEFRQMDLVDQVQALETLKAEGQLTKIPELIELFQDQNIDSTVNFMIGMTLRELLSKSEADTLAGLQHSDVNVRKLHVQVCGQQLFQEAAPRLLEMIRDKDNDAIFAEIFEAMTKIQAPEFLQVFKEYVNDSDKALAAMAVEMIGAYKETDAFDTLCDIVETAEEDANYKICDLTTGAAIEALGRMQDDFSMSYLVSRIHHRNPTARLMIHDELVKRGEAAVPMLAALFDDQDEDMKIMACNIIGRIGSRKGGEAVIAAADRGKLNHPNTKYALYEALGSTPFMKGFVFLMDGLSEPDDLLLTAAVSSLDAHVNPGVLQRFSEIIQKNDDQSQRLGRAIVTAGALNIFSQLYNQDRNLAEKLMAALAACHDPQTIETFRGCLMSMGDVQAEKDAKTLAAAEKRTPTKRILAADDSKAMLAFYRSTLSSMGFHVMTAENGKEAMDLLENGETFDLILTDMNMPIMDGIEFTRKLRQHPATKTLPVIMITTETEQSQVALATEAGVNAFLTKPFGPDVLQGRVNEVI